MKICPHCKNQLSFEHYAKSKSRKDGYDIFCRECNKIKRRARIDRNPELQKQKDREWKLKHPEFNDYLKNYYQINRKNILAQMKRAYQNNPLPAKTRTKQWQLNNKGKVVSQSRMYQLSKIQRTPKWLTETDKENIDLIYTTGAELNLQVDHVIPLRGKTVSGLHVPSNLQLLSPKENNEKKNKFHSLEFTSNDLLL